MAQGKHPNIPGSELISEAEMVALRQEAKAKVKSDAVKTAKKLMLEQMLREENQTADPDEVISAYTIDLPGYAANVTVDGVQYLQGETYQLGARQLSSIREIVQSAWKHEDSIGGAHANEYRKPRGFAFRGDSGTLLGGQSAR